MQKCSNGGHKCEIPERKKRRTPLKRERLLNEIQKQGEEVEKLIATLAKLEEANKQNNALRSTDTSDSGSPPTSSTSSASNTISLVSELAYASQDQDVVGWIAKARESLAELEGFIRIGNTSTPESCSVSEGSSGSGDEADSGNQAVSWSDGENEFVIIDDEGAEWGLQDSDRKRPEN
ncbi:hypothetical protein GYMLUDRAFT_955426 [Collybiopsis luxurians FD-317 M1]|nr:hypothetical protein GYMLUDRAFT_955426 [Collybiopsis luxurians FD-317 M1]